jgi:hypothetical protein
MNLRVLATNELLAAWRGMPSGDSPADELMRRIDTGEVIAVDTDELLDNLKETKK